MPYTHRKVGNKDCVFKKEDGSKVGCTSGSIDKYLGALHANASESVKSDEIVTKVNESTKELIKRLIREKIGS